MNAGIDDAIGTLNHEIIHALRDEALWGKPYGLFSATEWRSLVAKARADKALMAKIKEDCPRLDSTGQAEEAVAELYRIWRSGRDSIGAVGKSMERVKGFVEAVVNALTGAGFVDAASVFRKIADGKMSDGKPPSGPKGRFTSDSPEKDMHIGKAWQSALVGLLQSPGRKFPELTVSHVSPVLERIGVPKGTI